jgi:hypothetical protein
MNELLVGILYILAASLSSVRDPLLFVPSIALGFFIKNTNYFWISALLVSCLYIALGAVIRSSLNLDFSVYHALGVFVSCPALFGVGRLIALWNAARKA